MTLLVRYLLFAALSTAANLIVQEAAFRLSPIAPFMVALLAGTVAGFAVKYVLDKRWIFADAYESPRDEMRKVSLYGLFSVLTTLIFWGFEIAFWMTFGTTAAKYTGAVIGLSIGYALKYRLDRAYTFRERAA